MVLHFDEEHVAGFVETNFVGLVQQSLNGRTAIAGVAFGSGSRYRREAVRLHVEAADTVVSDLAEVERAIRADYQAVRIVGLSSNAWAAITGEAGDTGSGDGRYALRGGAEDQGEKEDCE